MPAFNAQEAFDKGNSTKTRNPMYNKLVQPILWKPNLCP